MLEIREIERLLGIPFPLSTTAIRTLVVDYQHTAAFKAKVTFDARDVAEVVSYLGEAIDPNVVGSFSDSGGLLSPPWWNPGPFRPSDRVFQWNNTVYVLVRVEQAEAYMFIMCPIAKDKLASLPFLVETPSPRKPFALGPAPGVFEREWKGTGGLGSQ